MRLPSGASLVAGVAGSPVSHSLSPAIHTAWLSDLGLDGLYVPFPVPPGRFEAFVEGLRGQVVRGLNVTLPFKEEALRLADRSTARAQAAGAANLFIFSPDGAIEADNTDGLGVLEAFAEQAPGLDLRSGPVVILGAGGASRGAAATLLEAGCPQVRIVNRTLSRAEEIAAYLGPPVEALPLEHLRQALGDACAIINATSAGLAGGEGLDIPFSAAPPSAVVLDMTYKPLRTPLLQAAQASGLRTVDGLAMLVGQAKPSFEAFFGTRPPEATDVRKIILQRLESKP